MTGVNYSFSTLPFQEVQSFLLETDTTFPTPLSQSVNIDAYAEKLSKWSVFSLCRNQNGAIIGMISCYLNNPPTGYISNACVKSDYQGEGVFSTLFTILRRKAIQLGFSSLQLEVDEMNENGLAVYHHLGFVIIERRECSHKLLLQYDLDNQII